MENEIKYSPCHVWGDKDFDWDGLDAAGLLIGKYCRRWGRLGIHWKEKYGTLRVTPWFFSGGLHSLIRPGYVHYRGWPKLAISLDIKLTGMICTSWLTSLVRKYQKAVLRSAYRRAIKEYPHIKEEILDDYWEECYGKL